MTDSAQVQATYQGLLCSRLKGLYGVISYDAQGRDVQQAIAGITPIE